VKLKRSKHPVRILAVLIGLLVLGNAGIAAAVPVTRMEVGAVRPAADVKGVHNLRVVDDKVWRGDAPGPEGYLSLAAAGVTTIVDLRAEHDIKPPLDLMAEHGITWVHLPVRDGQTPTREQVVAFRQAVDDSKGLVYVHCGAGVGRTGSMAGAYLVSTGEQSAGAALADNLSVGPPSMEQIWYVASMDATLTQPPAVVSAISRVFDAPRRIWSRLT
jgi:protein tyrosine phosphatase (PTP) superfamily phosphohydrolase (DUF442 family)